MGKELIKTACLACLRILSKKIIISALLLLTLSLTGGTPFVEWVTGRKAMLVAFADFLANVAGFVDNPLVRVVLAFISLWLILVGVKQVVEQERLSANTIIDAKRVALIEQRTMLDIPIAIARNDAHRRELDSFKAMFDQQRAIVLNSLETESEFWGKPQTWLITRPYVHGFRQAATVNTSFQFFSLPVPKPNFLNAEPIALAERVGSNTTRQFHYNPDENEEFLKKFKQDAMQVRQWLERLEAAYNNQKNNLAKLDTDLSGRLAQYAW